MEREKLIDSLVDYLENASTMPSSHWKMLLVQMTNEELQVVVDLMDKGKSKTITKEDLRPFLKIVSKYHPKKTHTEEDEDFYIGLN